MPRKPRGGGSQVDDIIKGLLNAMDSQVLRNAPKAARGVPKALKKSERVVTGGVKKFEKTVKPKPEPLVTKAKPKGKKKARPQTQTGSSGGGSRKPPTKGVTAGGQEFPVPKRPPREGMGIYQKGRSLPISESEKREAERAANFWLRKGGKPPRPARPEDVRMGTGKGVPPKVGTSKSRPKGPKSDYEADRLRRESAADARRIGSGVRKAAKKKPPKGGKYGKPKE